MTAITIQLQWTASLIHILTILTFQPFDKCYIGSSPRTTVESSFCGQMSSISLFGDCLPNTTISALYRLGADYKVSLVGCDVMTRGV